VMEPSTRENSELVESLVSAPPLLHIWHTGPSPGGMEGAVGYRLVRIIRARPSSETFDVLETGAGLTTLLFLALGATKITSVDPTEGLRDRVLDEAARRQLDTNHLEYLEERSEIALPKLFTDGRQYDVCLIDGSHAWPTVFVDFCYANACLREGGVMLIDDVQLHSVRQLFLLLAGQPEYRLISEQWDWKVGAFVKETPEPFLPYVQPFIVASTGGLV
jgi:hypothetical protein